VKSEATLFRLFIEFFKMGMFTVGGGMAMVPVLQDMTERNKWMTPEETLDCIAVCQSLPGVVAINMATYVGSKKRGPLGALCTTCGILLPSLIIIILVAMFMGRIDQNAYVQGALSGIRAAAAGLIGWATWSMGKQVLRGKGWFAWALAAVSFTVVGFFGVSAVWVILGGILLGIAYNSFTSAKAAKGGAKE
jgi:chromate transporter